MRRLESYKSLREISKSRQSFVFYFFVFFSHDCPRPVSLKLFRIVARNQDSQQIRATLGDVPGNFPRREERTLFFISQSSAPTFNDPSRLLAFPRRDREAIHLAEYSPEPPSASLHPRYRPTVSILPCRRLPDPSFFEYLPHDPPRVAFSRPLPYSYARATCI